MRSGGSFRDFVIFYSEALFLYPVSLCFVRWKTPYSSALVLDLVVICLLIYSLLHNTQGTVAV